MKVKGEFLEQPRGTRSLCSIRLIDGFEQSFFFSSPSVLFLHSTSKSNIKEYVSKERHSYFNEAPISTTETFPSPTDVSLSCRRLFVQKYQSDEANLRTSSQPDIYAEESNSSRMLVL